MIELKKERVLVTGASKIGQAGVATIVYQWGQHFDTSKIIYDYLMQGGLPDEKFQDKIKQQGSLMFTLPPERRTAKHIIKWVEHIVRKGKYRIIHINSDSAYIAAAYIFAAKKGGIKKIVVHSHSSFIDENNAVKRGIKILLHKAMLPYVMKEADCRLACSAKAAHWMFGEKKDYTWIPNGVEVDDYKYNEKDRKSLRTDMGIGNKIALCNVGRFSYQKKHQFLLNIFEQYHKKHPDSFLYLIGTGELEGVLRQIVCKKQMEKSVIFLGQRYDVGKLLSAMDIMVMPSRFEGLPVTLVEAQMADLPCIVSGAVTRESDFTGLIRFVDSWDIDGWVKAIERVPDSKRGINADKKQTSIFNIEVAANKLADVLLRDGECSK